MTRQQIKDLIGYELRYYGRGYKYRCELNGKFVDSITDLKNNAEEGDDVKIKVYKGHQGYWGGYEVDRILIAIDSKYYDEYVAKWAISKNNTSIFSDKPSDSQKNKLYRWERSHFKNFKLDRTENLKEAQEFVNSIFDGHDTISPPKVKFSASRKRSCSYFGGFRHEIRIADWGFSRLVLVHEATHAFIDQLGLDSFVGSHGPFFVRLYIQFLSEFLGHDELELVDSAKKHGLDVASHIDIDYWISLKKSGNELTVSDINNLRNETYIFSDGTKLTENQIDVLKDIANGIQEVDGRSAAALLRKNVLSKENGKYKICQEANHVSFL